MIQATISTKHSKCSAKSPSHTGKETVLFNQDGGGAVSVPVFKFSGIGPESRVTTPGYFTGGYGHNGHFSIGQVEGEITDVTDENQAFEISIDLWDTDPLIADDEHIAYKTFKVLPTEQIQRSEQLQADGIADSSKLPRLEYILRPADHPAYNWITIRP